MSEAGFRASDWAAVGIGREEALAWWRARVDVGDALRWRRAGVTQPIDAVRWRTAGVGIEALQPWLDAGISSGEAVVWVELGFDARAAGAHKRAGRSPVQAYGREGGALQPLPMRPGPGGTAFVTGRSVTRAGGPGRGAGMHRLMEAVHRDPKAHQVVHSYVQRHWFDDEAIAWASHAIDAAEAIAWKELGLTPVEAARQQDADRSAMQTAKAWWRAGIPVDEVADWIGAGLTPEEAAEQRAAGVTVERAAILRSLRKHER